MYSRKYLAVISSFIILFASIFSYPTLAYAFDNKYTDDFEQWSKIKQFIYVNNDDQIYAKCMSNENDACFYLYVYYATNDDNDDSVKLDFEVYNDKTKYDFVIDNSSKYDDSKLKNIFSIYRNFTKIDKDKSYNEFIIAFEFKNKQDKSLLNYINCKLSINNSNSYNLINKYKMDMYVPENKSTKPTTQKPTISTSKVTTTKQATTKSTTNKKYNSNVKQKSTKFTPSNKVTKSSRRNSSNVKSSTKFTPKSKGSVVSTTKFSADTKNVDTEKSTKFDANKSNDNTTDTLIQNEVNNQQETSEIQYSLTSRKLERSNKAKALIAVAACLGFAGVLLILIGTVSGKYKIVKNSKNDDKEN